MTKKHYEAIASVISSCHVDKDGRISKAALIGYFRHLLYKENPRFNADKFTEACGK